MKGVKGDEANGFVSAIQKRFAKCNKIRISQAQLNAADAKDMKEAAKAMENSHKLTMDLIQKGLHKNVEYADTSISIAEFDKLL